MKNLLYTFMILVLGSGNLMASIKLDTMRYSGKWYEVASTHPIYQSYCTCTEVNYSVNERNNLSIENVCRK